jgi:hypothetical protein
LRVEMVKIDSSTVTDMERDKLPGCGPYVAMISASPSPIVVTNPCASTEATFSSVERHETFDESRTRRTVPSRKRA